MTRFLLLCFVAVFTTSAFEASAQVPKLNSYPTASATIFLDFDGQTVNSPYWNGGVSFYCTVPSFTSDQVTTIFNQVAEDYRPFNLNITTDSTVYFAAPATKRQRIIISGYSAWYGNAGGVAYVESFRWGMEIPGFVFANLLGYNTKSVGDAASHETGHTLGLNHQSKYDASCGFLNEYNPGTGSGEIGWAPIMGYSYSKNLSLWHNGSSNFGCSSLQNDLAIISSAANGFGYRTDDIGNTTATASNLPISGQIIGTSGFINTTADVDMFRITLPENGRLNLNATPFNTAGGYQSANIDLEIDLLNNAGTVIKHYNPSTTVQAIADSILNAGTYFIKITNASNANTSNYGMLGSYSVTGTFVAGAALPIYSLAQNGAVANNKHELSWNIIADEPIETVTVEISSDGRTFTNLQDVSGSLRKFVYQPFEKGTAYYRLHVVTASQLKYYSNIISLREAKGGGKYSLVSNIIHGNSISINSNESFGWRILDMNGRSIANGRMSTGFNHLNATNLSNGMYLLQIMDGTEILTEKIVKQ
jgi:hypothetical protein